MKLYKSVEFLLLYGFQAPPNKPKDPRRNAKTPYWKFFGDGSALLAIRRKEQNV